VDYYAKIQERCVAKPESYEERAAKREAEIKGLKEALNVLETETALVQHKKRGRHGGHFLGFLTASYHPTHRAWEANRLTKNMAMATIVTASPVTYCSGQLLTIAICIMFFYTVYHVRTHPYKLNVLNYIETASLMVLTTSMALSDLIVSPPWYITTSFGRALVYVVFTLLLTNVLFLMAVWAWAKFALTNDHAIFTDSA